MKFLLVTLTVIAILSQSQAATFENNAIEEESASPRPSIEDATVGVCQERVCTRIYRPLCVSIDGAETTLPSRCHLVNFRCATMKRTLKSANKPAPVFRVLHEGDCYEKPRRRPNSRRQTSIEDRKYRGRF